jgi:hypothetical protein
MAFFYILDITLKFGYQKSQETAFLTFFSKTFTTKKQIEKIIGTAETKSTTNRGFQLSTSTGPNSACKGHLVISFITTPRHYYMCVNCTSLVVGCFAVSSS